MIDPDKDSPLPWVNTRTHLVASHLIVALLPLMVTLAWPRGTGTDQPLESHSSWTNKEKEISPQERDTYWRTIETPGASSLELKRAMHRLWLPENLRTVALRLLLNHPDPEVRQLASELLRARR